MYTKALGIQGFYNTLVDHAQNMAICKTFLKGIPAEMRQVLIHHDELSPEINEVEEFIVHAICYEQALKMACHFNYHSSRVKGLSSSISEDPC